MNSVVLYENSTKPESYRWAEYVAEYLLAKGIPVYAREELVAKLSSEVRNFVKTIPIHQFEKYADVCITLGGDGTVLHAAKDLFGSDIPIMGINIGRLGFLAEFPVDEIDKGLNDLVEGNYRVVDRSYIKAEVFKNEEIEKEMFAINDFIIEKSGSSRMITINTWSDEHLVAEYRADGLVITTPTGSTAYSLSCNGPVIPPSANVLCLTPISPHTLTLRPLILPDTTILSFSIYSHNGRAKLVSDGGDDMIIETDNKIIITKVEERFKMIKPNNKSYFELLREKLYWAKNPGSRN